MFWKKKDEKKDITQLVKCVDLINQPVDLGSFYPTEDTIISLLNHQIAIVHMRRDYYEDNANEERDIFVCYSPWIISE